MKPNYGEKTVEEMMEKVMKNEKLKNKMLSDFGFTDEDYTDEDMKYICYTIMYQNGIKDTARVAKAMYLTVELAKASTQAKSFDELGIVARKLLEECKVIY